LNAAFRLFLVWGLLCACSASAALSPDGSQPLTAGEVLQGYRQHRILVRPHPARSGEARNEERALRARTRREFSEFDGARVLELDPADSADAAIARLRATGLYDVVERDILRHALIVPNDPSFAQQWGLRNTGQSGGTVGADINATSGWDTLSDASSVVVAIIDSGIRITHEDLVDNLWNSAGVHGINAIGSTTTNDPTDDNGHGTHVAGIIGATGNNATGIAGVAWRTQLMALKFLPADGSGTLSDELECIQYAISHGAKVINASFGSSASSSIELNAIKNARDAGIIFVAAAGNGTDDDGIGVNNDTVPSFPSNYALDNIVSVAATTRTDALADFSNYGAGAVDLAAPGAAITSTYKDSDRSYATLSGTSMATPHVTGALALLRAKYPNDTYRQIINRLLRGVTKTSALLGKVQSGGRLNLASALTGTSNRPFNDGFAERATLAGANVRVRSGNAGATLDNGEPAHGGATAGASLWWSWTPTVSTEVAFDTAGSTTSADAPLDTVLAVYTGAAVDALQPVGANDDAASGTVTSRVVLNVTAGTTYQIAVAGKAGATGMVILRIGSVPTNDNFARAASVSGESFSVTSSLLNATREAGEPTPSGGSAGHSVWYQWTAPAAGLFQLAAFATQIDTVASVYTGSAVNSLTTVASNQNSSSTNSDALVPFTATAGATYYFCVDQASTDQSDGGEFTLTLAPAAWEYPAGDEVTSSPAVGPDGTLYFGAGSTQGHDTKVYAVTSTGGARWTFTAGANGIITASPAVGSDGTVYVGGSDKILYALNGSTGAKLWSFTATSEISSTPAIAADGTIYFRDDTHLYALTSTGTQKWAFNFSGTAGTYCSPVIGTDGTVYVGSTGGVFYAVKPDGTQKWSFNATDNSTAAGDSDIYTSPALAADGTIYFANLLGTVYALTDSGSAAARKWTWTTSDRSSITSSIAVGGDGTLYFAGYDHKLHALTGAGSEKWSCTLGNEVRASSPAVAADGTIYVGCYDGRLYAVSAAGAVQHAYATARMVRSSPVIAGSRVYVGSADAKLYAFNIGQAASGSAWPMFHRNAAHTGQASGVAIVTQPVAQAVVAGSSVSLSVSATASGTIAYQWYKDGAAIAGATSSSFAIAAATPTDTGLYTVVVSSAGSSVTSAAAQVTVVAAGGPATTMVNISARGYCSTGNSVMIGGFVIGGGVSKRILVRAVGPSLTAQGISTAEALADPAIELHRYANGVDSVVATNDNWTDNSNAAEITSVASQVGAAALLSSDTTSAALLRTLDPGVYTFIARGQNNSSGIVLLEVYDAESTNRNAHFVDIAARAQCQTGNRIAIGGFVITGSVNKRVLLRAVGPSLTAQGLGASEVLQDPTIELHRLSGGVDTTIGTNDNWGDNPNAADIPPTAARIGASALSSSDTTSAAMLRSLEPGVYTFIARGRNDTTGIVLVEVYDAD
jgi:outer membrane protein assembly factor BamB/subtilisin family serine protease